MFDFSKYISRYFPDGGAIKTRYTYDSFYELIYNLSKSEFTKLTELYKYAKYSNKSNNILDLKRVIFAVYNEDITIYRLLECLSNDIDESVENLKTLASSIETLWNEYSKIGGANKFKKLRELYNMKVHINTNDDISYSSNTDFGNDLNRISLSSEYNALDALNIIKDDFFTKYTCNDNLETSVANIFSSTNYITMLSALLNYDRMTLSVLNKILLISNITTLTDTTKNNLVNNWRKYAENFREDLKKLDKGVLHY